MKKEKTYTIGEVFRLGLLKNYNGEPFKHKSTVSRAVNRMKFEIEDGPWGKAKVVSEKEIEKMNKMKALQ